MYLTKENSLIGRVFMLNYDNGFGFAHIDHPLFRRVHFNKGGYVNLLKTANGIHMEYAVIRLETVRLGQEIVMLLGDWNKSAGHNPHASHWTFKELFAAYDAAGPRIAPTLVDIATPDLSGPELEAHLQMDAKRRLEVFSRRRFPVIVR